MLQILEYLEAYTEHFGFGKSIIFRTEVLSVVPSPDGSFIVSTKVSSASFVVTRTRFIRRAHITALRNLVNTNYLMGPSKSACRVLGMVQSWLLTKLQGLSAEIAGSRHRRGVDAPVRVSR